MPYLSASAVVVHYEEALYQVYAPLPLPLQQQSNCYRAVRCATACTSCILSFLRKRKRLSQSGHWNGRSPAWIMQCWRSVLWSTNVRPHTSHAYGRSPAQTSFIICRVGQQKHGQFVLQSICFELVVILLHHFGKPLYILKFY